MAKIKLNLVFQLQLPNTCPYCGSHALSMNTDGIIWFEHTLDKTVRPAESRWVVESVEPHNQTNLEACYVTCKTCGKEIRE